MPWFLIKGDVEANVATAYHRIRTIANEAERRMPRMTGAATKPAPRAKLNFAGPRTPSPEPEPQREVTVSKTANDGHALG